MAKTGDPKRAAPAAGAKEPGAAKGGGVPAPRHARTFVALDQIVTSHARAREVNPKHVQAVAGSIAAIGLIHPPAVDRANRLLAGAHRLAALHWLHDHAHKRFVELFPKGVPVWRMDLSADSDADLALAVEIAENEQRRDYDKAEILALANRLKAAGFHYSAEGGRPRADARPLMPALEAIVGKSVRQLRRVLNPPVPQKTRTPDLVSELKRLLAASEQISARLAPSAEVPELFSLKAELERVKRLTVAAVGYLEKARGG